LAVPRPREGGLQSGKIFGSTLLQPADTVCVSLSAFFIIFGLHRSLVAGMCCHPHYTILIHTHALCSGVRAGLHLSPPKSNQLLPVAHIPPV